MRRRRCSIKPDPRHTILSNQLDRTVLVELATVEGVWLVDRKVHPISSSTLNWAIKVDTEAQMSGTSLDAHFIGLYNLGYIGE